jgi:hypothetical protein
MEHQMNQTPVSVSLITYLLLFSADFLFAGSQTIDSLHDGLFYIEAKPVSKFSATLIEKWNWTAKEVGSGTLTIYAPVLPQLPGQDKVATRLMFTRMLQLIPDTIIEQGVDKRQMLALRIPGSSFSPREGIILRLTYKGTLYARTLKQGKPPKPVPPLIKEEQQQYLASSATMDYDNKDFQRWMKEQKLVRRDDEEVVRFGYRVFQYLITNCKYGGDTSCDALKPSRVCKTMASDCGGLALLFVAVMRANKVPARTLFGRWDTTQTDSYGQHHVMAEFFVDNSGWVPVDISRTIVLKPDDTFAFFGNMDGRHIAFHVDTDLIPEKFWNSWAQNLIPRWFGPASLGLLQRFDSKWQVSCEAVKN